MRAGGSGCFCESSAMPMFHTAAHSFIPSPREAHRVPPPSRSFHPFIPSTAVRSIDLQVAKSINTPSRSSSPLPLPSFLLYPLSCLHCYLQSPRCRCSCMKPMQSIAYHQRSTAGHPPPKVNKVLTDLILPGFRAAALRAVGFAIFLTKRRGKSDAIATSTSDDA